MSMKFKNPIEVDGYVSAEYADLSTTTSHSVSVGEIAWNATDGTFDMGLIGSVTLQAGQEMYIYGKATEAISNGDAVMFGGVQGEHLLLSKADATTINANPEYFIGVSTQDFATNDFGYVTVFGKVRTLNTTGYSLGAVLYYDSTTSTDGKLTATEPSAPNAKIIVAAVVKVHATQGVLMVRPHIMPTLSEIQDVNTSLSKTTPVNTDNLLLQDSADQSIWKKLSWSNLKATLKSYFDTIYQSVLTNPITGTGTTNYVPKFTGSTTLGNSQIFDNGTNVGIGDSNPGYKLTVIGNGYFNDNVLIGNGSQLRFTIPGINIKPELVSSTWSDLSFSTNNSEKMRITSAGNVGIGTSSPSERLEVQNGASGAKIKVSNSGGGYAMLECSSNATSVAQLSFTNQLSLIGGNVGIGTSSPSALLNVIGDVHLGSYSNSSTVNLENRTSKGIFIISTDGVTNAAGTTITYSWANGGHGPLKFNNASSEVMRLEANGNVGIGTSAPTSKLTVNDSTAFSWGFPSLASAKIGASGTGGSFMVMTPSLNSSYESGFAVDGTYNSGKSVINLSAFGVYSGGPYSADIAFKTATNTTLSEKMRITNDGNVGIGTTSPSSILHLNSAVPFLSIQGSTTGSLRGINIMQGTTVFSSLSAEASLGETRLSAGFSGWGGFQTFHTNGSEKMRITSDGYMLLGTAFAQYGNANRGTFEINGASDNIFAMKVNNSLAGYLYASGSFTELYSTNHILFSTSGNERMRITTSGNVGIGTSSPSVKLNVIGQVIFDDGTLGTISPEPNSILQLESDRKGFLPPRLTETQRNNIGVPVAGLMIFNKDSNYLEVYDGSNWRALAYV